MVLRMETWGQDPQTAADAPRWQVISGRRVLVEPEFDVDVLASLGEMGHDIAVEPGNVSFGFGGAQIVRRIPGGYVGGSDPRKDGHVGGY
jgi:gamma-glutamyltranspeptidase/glutathione hydrolase